MVQLEYTVVDVFTDRALAGNPLAVVVDTAGLSMERMQAIAREFNLSETTFIQRRAVEVERAEGVRVRIFTTQEELPFAGHPTLGTASVLRMIAPETLCDDTVRLALNVGSVPVRFSQDGAAPDLLFGEMTQRDPEFGPELDRRDVARLTGVALEELDPLHAPQVVSTGTAFAIVLLNGARGLSRLNVNHDEATPYLRSMGGRWFYVLAPDQESDGAPSFRARMQFYGGEDPATGSAAGCAISFLVAHGIVPGGKRIHLRQGIEMGRPSDLFLRARREDARVTDVRVAGSTVLVAKGKILLP
jgi:trans-2,3-dihydro-3-hydroxyanthranilate isomerase